MKEFQERVIEEHKELKLKWRKLTAFLGSETWPKLPQAERQRLERQVHIMTLYVQVLKERIEAFESAETENPG